MPRRSKYHPIDLNVREGQEGYNMIAIHCPPPIGMKDMNQIEQKLVRTRPTAVSAAGAVSNSHHTNNNNNSNSNSNSNGGSLVGDSIGAAGSSTAPTLTVAQQAAAASKRTKMAMTVAMNPAQALGMNVLMLYMSGSQLNIFSIQTTSSAIMTPITNILSMEHIFGQFSTTASSSTSSTTNEDDTTIPKLIFIAINLLWLCIGLYKMSSMRLLPTTSADYTYKVLWKQRMETTSIPPDDTFIF